MSVIDEREVKRPFAVSLIKLRRGFLQGVHEDLDRAVGGVTDTKWLDGGEQVNFYLSLSGVVFEIRLKWKLGIAANPLNDDSYLISALYDAWSDGQNEYGVADFHVLKNSTNTVALGLLKQLQAVAGKF